MASSSHSLSPSSLVTDDTDTQGGHVYKGEVDLKQAHISVNHFLLLHQLFLDPQNWQNTVKNYKTDKKKKSQEFINKYNC